ncbi:MAG: M48 family metalloprotease [Pseudomonadota bacterium]
MKHLLAIAVLCLLPAYALSQADNLPEFGEGNAVSLNQEYYLGRAWLMSFRRQAPLMNDPLVQDYIEELIYNLVETSQLRERRLEILLVDNKTINAFAVPGGVVGIHSGLIAKAETEAQLSSVMAHELAHLSQRHFSRGIEAQKQSSVASLAGLLGGLVMVATGAGDAGMAAIMGGQAAAMDSQLRYSRAHEQEADRIGMQNQYAAGFDPGGAAGMFEVMQRDMRAYGASPPEFLLTHPLTESRISDARNRAHGFPRKIYEDNPEFQLMRARVELNFIEDDEAAVQTFRDKRAKGGKLAVANQYGLVLALTRNGEFAEARELLKPMREFNPTSIPYSLAEADILIEEEKYTAAINMLKQLLKLVPDNHPISMYLAKAYYRAGKYSEAAQVLESQAEHDPSDAHLWYLLAEVEGKAGNIMAVHLARAEYFALNGAMETAMKQLNMALPLAQDEVTRERIMDRQDHFKNIAAALKQLS